MRQNSKYSKGAFAILLLACATTAFAGKVDAIFTHAGLAIRGYDPVAYHLQAQPAKGTPSSATSGGVPLGSSPPQRIVTGSTLSRSATPRSTVDTAPMPSAKGGLHRSIPRRGES